MKPEWKDAPEWANWLAMDEDGWWYWYARKPIKDDGQWLSTGSSIPDASSADWWTTLEQRHTTDEE